MPFDIDDFRVLPGNKLDLSKRDPSATPSWGGDKKAGQERLEELNSRLEELQDLLWAEGKHRVLFVIQAMDAGGKDGTIRHVFDGVNPSGVKVASFKKPSSKELAHDYLWRAHQKVPANGELTIFNRSHYEDVLAVRVLNLVPEKRWKRRYKHLVDFEQMLVDEGTTIIKIFLHISKDEQKERLQARLDEPENNWKFEIGDLESRSHWEAYHEAFEDAINKTSTKDSPWYVIPANRKWYRNIAVSEILIQTLENLDMKFPDAPEGLEQVVID